MAVALSALIATPVRVVRIRARRPNPGLAAQHATAIRAIAKLCGGEATGLEVGSPMIEFRPGAVSAGRFSFDVGTAGSVTLVLQAVVPVACAAPGPVRLHLVGGTDVRWSPPIDYFGRVLLPLLRRLGARVHLEVQRRGYYPRGGGVVEVVIEPTPTWSPLDLRESTEVPRVRGIAHVSNLSEEIPKRMKHAVVRRLHGFADVKIEERVYRGEEAIGQGGALVAWAETVASFLGADSLAERGRSSERIGEEVGAELAADVERGATVDRYAADQVLLYLARAQGPSRFRCGEISGHTETMMWLLPQFLPVRFDVSRDGRSHQVTVEPDA